MSSDELQMVNELLRSQDMAAMTLEEQRDLVEAGAGGAAEGATVEPVDANGVACEWVYPSEAASDRTIMALRGGGYCLGSLTSNRRFAGLVSEAAGARVLNVGYRRAPEARFPAALDDAVAAYTWLLQSGTPPSALAVVGNSAGGGLALATLLTLRDAGMPMPACGAVISPWTDLAATGASVASNAATEVLLDPASLRTTAELYADPDQLTLPGVSPLYGDPTGLPPLLVHVSGSEILLDDSLRFVARARAAGVAVELQVVDGMPHVWHLFAGFLPDADTAVAALGRWVAERAG